MDVAPNRRSRQHVALRHPLIYPLPSPRLLRLFLLLPALAALLLGLAWLTSSRPTAWQVVAMGGAILLALTCVWRLPLWMTGTFLQWSGTKWGFAVDGRQKEGELRGLVVAMDGQTWLLIKAQWVAPVQVQQRWLLLTRASKPERWPDIRRVLYSSLAADAS
ncbi:MAG: hypothetical protein RSD57_06560 [Comamonas sp.]